MSKEHGLRGFDLLGQSRCGCLQAVEKMAKEFKARMTVRLAVAGAFHTHFMQPAEEKLRWGPYIRSADDPAAFKDMQAAQYTVASAPETSPNW